jgi:hypothetical protein
MSFPCGLHFVTGKKGGGKTMLCSKLSWDILGMTDRHLVTNIPISWPGLQTYFEERWPDRVTGIRDRITQLSIEEMRTFWLVRGAGWVIPNVTKEDWEKLGHRTDYRYAYRYAPSDDPGKRVVLLGMSKRELDALVSDGEVERVGMGELPSVQYCIDEIHTVFGAREWQNTSHQMCYYLSQQRKLGDDLMAITQRPALVDKQLRELADDWLLIENYGRKQHSVFRLPAVCRWEKYDHLPGLGSRPMVTGSFRVDISGVGQTYDTSAGVGIEGGLSADKNSKPRGTWHWAWLILVAILFVAAFALIPRMFIGGARGLLGMWFGDSGLGSQVVVAAGGSEVSEVGDPEPFGMVPPAPPPRLRTLAEIRGESTGPDRRRPESWERSTNVWLRSVVMRGQEVDVVLTDGSRWDQGRSDLWFVGRDRVVIAGVIYEREPYNSNGSGVLRVYR